jgi:hypothetical protein
MTSLKIAPFHLREARKTAEALFRTLPDFCPSNKAPHPKDLTNNFEKILTSSIKKHNRLSIEAAFHAGYISEDTRTLALSHPVIARAAARILKTNPEALTSPAPLLAHETIRELRGLTRRKCNIQRLLRRSAFNWKDVATIVLQGVNEGCLTHEEALYALSDGVAFVQLARALRLRQAIAA